LVIFDNRPSRRLSRLDDLEGRKALHTKLAAEGFVRFFITVDSGYLRKTSEVFRCLFVRWLEVLAVAAPGSVEFDDLDELVESE